MPAKARSTSKNGSAGRSTSRLSSAIPTRSSPSSSPTDSPSTNGRCGLRFTPDEATAARRADGYFEWIECGLDLWARLRQLDIPVVEGFPTASWTAWLGPPARSTRAVWTTRGLEWLRLQGVTGLDGVRNQADAD